MHLRGSGGRDICNDIEGTLSKQSIENIYHGELFVYPLIGIETDIQQD